MENKGFKILLYPPLCFSEKGKRDQNEDSIFPPCTRISENDRLFLVCDGVGGNHMGEVASSLACKGFHEYFQKHPSEPVDQNYISEAFSYTQTLFDDFFNHDPKAKGMATTLVLITFNASGCYVAHCGDSRCYHIRQNKILWKSFDHTTLNELVINGIISQEEADSSPKSNRISRAMQGNSVKRVKPDIHQIEDIQADDYFFLCSDGVWSCISDNELIDILTSSNSEIGKIKTVKYLCEANSDDNFSAIMLKIRTLKSNPIDKIIDLKPNLYDKFKRFFA